jgi:hypothetical protein
MRAIKLVTKNVATALRPNLANGISVSPSLLRRHPGPLALTGPFESETGALILLNMPSSRL